MTWPKKVYCATTNSGIYYTSNFDGVNQPTWLTINTGLASTSIQKFALDPFTPALKQYCLANVVLYRRDNGGSWASILTGAAGDALVGGGESGGIIAYFYCDRSVDGRIWAFYKGNHVSGNTYDDLYAFYSDDYGATWTKTAIMESGWASARTPGYIVADGDSIWANWTRGDGGHCSYSSNKGGTWGIQAISSSTDGLALNPLQPTIAYLSDNSGSGHIYSITTGGTLSTLISTHGFNRPDGLWFSASTANHQRAVDLSKQEIFHTANGWSTDTSPGDIGAQWPKTIAPRAGDDEDQMIVGLAIDHATTRNHIIGILYGEADTTSAGMAGTNCGISPFADSIPYSCGGLAYGGIAAIEETPTISPVPPDDVPITPPGGPPVTLGGTANVQAVTMPGYTGDDRGEPLPGDRGAWKTDTQDHAKLHGQDIKDEVSKVHLDPYNAANKESPRFNSTTGLFDYEEMLTLSEHTAIGNGSPHHAPVTEDATISGIVGLSGQQLSLAVQDAKKVMIGPVSGAAAAPTMRVLATTDLPSPLGFALAASALTIAAGAVTVTRSLHTLTSQSGITDDLDTITAAGDRTLLLLQATATHTITVKHGTGNISLNGAADFALSGYITLLLFWNGTKWVDVGAGGGGGGADANAIHINAAGEIHALTNKALGAAADEVVIEESVGGTWVKKKVTLSNLPYPAAAAHDHTTADGSGILTNDEHDGYSNYIAIAKPASPAAGAVRLYAKNKKMYQVDEDGTETDLTAGGAGGSVATDAIWDAKGDLAAGTGADAAARLAVGANGTVLTADDTQATGVKWAAPGGGSTDVLMVQVFS